MTRSLRPLIIYHGKCADGFSAAWCFWKVYGDSADYHEGIYSRPPPDVTGRLVYLVDFSYPKEVVEEMLDKAREIVLIDHHKTSIENLWPLFETEKASGRERFQWYCDLDRSGAMLAWNYLNPEIEPPPLLKHIQDRDLWRFELPHTREIQANVFSYEYTFENWDLLMSRSKEELEKMIPEGVAIERKHMKDIRELVSLSKRYMTIGGHRVPVANLPYTMTSDAAGMMSQGEAFAACYLDTPDFREFGLRSREEGLDVALIAQQYGGGGHARSSGFKVPRSHPLAQA